MKQVTKKKKQLLLVPLLLFLLLSVGLQGANDYLLRNSDQKLISEEDLYLLTLHEIKLIAAEILARHGYIFEDQDLRYYFSIKGWYRPSVKDKTKLKLGKIEKLNLERLENTAEELSTLQRLEKTALLPKVRLKQNQTLSIDLDGDGSYESLHYSVTAVNELTSPAPSGDSLPLNPPETPPTMSEPELKNGPPPEVEISYTCKLELYRKPQQRDRDGIDDQPNTIEEDVIAPLAIYTLTRRPCPDLLMIADTDHKNPGLEIILPQKTENGPAFALLRYRSGKFIKAATIPGGSPRFTGNGDILVVEQTTFIYHRTIIRIYQINEKGELNEKPVKYTSLNKLIKTLSPIKVYRNRVSAKEYFIIPEETLVRLLLTDNKRWLYIESETGERGWLQVKGCCTLESTDQLLRHHFDGLELNR